MTKSHEEFIEDESLCPLCGLSECKHLLLTLDVTFREAVNGSLFEKFCEQWGELTSSDAPLEDEGEAFDDLAGQVSAIAEAETMWDFDGGGPGQSCSYHSFYHANAQAVVSSFAFLSQEMDS